MKYVLRCLLVVFVFSFTSCQTPQQRAAVQAVVDNTKNDLENARADLNVANDEMRHIEQFHVMRTQREREEQIRNQTLKIQQLTDRVNALAKQLNDQQSRLQ